MSVWTLMVKPYIKVPLIQIIVWIPIPTECSYCLKLNNACISLEMNCFGTKINGKKEEFHSFNSGIQFIFTFFIWKSTEVVEGGWGEMNIELIFAGKLGICQNLTKFISFGNDLFSIQYTLSYTIPCHSTRMWWHAIFVGKRVLEIIYDWLDWLTITGCDCGDGSVTIFKWNLNLKLKIEKEERRLKPYVRTYVPYNKTHVRHKINLFSFNFCFFVFLFVSFRFVLLLFCTAATLTKQNVVNCKWEIKGDFSKGLQLQMK